MKSQRVQMVQRGVLVAIPLILAGAVAMMGHRRMEEARQEERQNRYFRSLRLNPFQSPKAASAKE